MSKVHTLGIDIGSGAVKSVLFSFDDQGHPTWVAKRVERILQVHNSYVVTQDEQGVVIVDQHALHERVMFERLLERVQRGPQLRRVAEWKSHARKTLLFGLPSLAADMYQESVLRACPIVTPREFMQAAGA